MRYAWRGSEATTQLRQMALLGNAYPIPCATKLGTSASSFVVVDAVESSIKPNE